MSYQFEINSTSIREMKIIVEYLGQQKHFQEIGSDKSQVKFSGNVVTFLSCSSLVKYTTNLDRIDYSLGYQNDEFEFVIQDTHKYHAKVYINFDKPMISERGEANSILFSRVVFTYSDPEDKEFLIRESWKWWHSSRVYCSAEETVPIYVNTEREYFKKIAERPKRDLNTIYLPESEKEKIVTKLENFLKPETRQLYERLGKAYKIVIALHGLPGTGKTSFIHALASKFDHSVSIYFNNKKTEDTDIPTLLQGIRANSFLVFEDADALFSTRENSGNKEMTFSTILNVLDGFASPVNPKNPLIIFVTTNCLDKLDKTMIRPGRIDHFMEFKEMKNKEIKSMMKKFSEESYTEELGTNLCRELKSYQYKVTPALLELHFFKYLNQPEEMISKIEEIGTIKDIVETQKKDLYS